MTPLAADPLARALLSEGWNVAAYREVRDVQTMVPVVRVLKLQSLRRRGVFRGWFA